MRRWASQVAATVVTAAILATGSQGATPSDRPEPGWLRALSIRSEALNRIYELGDFEPAWTRALRVRSEAMNRF